MVISRLSTYMQAIPNNHSVSLLRRAHLICVSHLHPTARTSPSQTVDSDEALFCSMTAPATASIQLPPNSSTARVGQTFWLTIGILLGFWHRMLPGLGARHIRRYKIGIADPEREPFLGAMGLGAVP